MPGPLQVPRVRPVHARRAAVLLLQVGCRELEV
jgi:hypothetical protein